VNLKELQSFWQKEKEHYKKSEVGSGVQSFVWEVFKNPDLFNLSRGLKSTDDHRRKGEFLLEESTKNGQADAVIFMDSEVVIPVEVEKYEKAQDGEWQILKYRTSFDKKYGILTDGFEWRFYYGDIADKKHYKLTIDEIFSKPERFRTFLDEYIKPQNYYLSFFEEIGQQKMELFDEKKSVDEHRERFFEDVTDIIRKLKDKLLNAGYFRSFKDEHERDKKATEIAYSYLIQFILYKTLVDNAFDDFEAEFAKREALVHQNLKKGSFNSVLMILEGMSQKISENIYKPFHEEQKAIIEQVKDIVHSGEENIMSVAPFLDIFFFIRTYHFADVQNDIFGAIYENYLKELYEEQQLGQYFTDPSVVNFMLEEIGYDAEEIRKRGHENISIIDPSCGSGTFLYSAAREIVKAGNYSTEEGSKKIENEVLQNIFGLDIAEFPLYLAEMGILMKMLPMIVNQKYNNPIEKKIKLFVTEDSVAEFIGEIGGRAAAGSDMQMQAALGWKYEGFMRDERDLDEMKGSLKTQGGGAKTIPRRRFDFVIGNPPYIGYNECSAAGVKIFQMLKEKDSGVSLNDIYGWNLHSVPGNRKKYSPKPNLYSFFLALGFALLKENGRFCYIIPQTLLTAGDLDVLRYQLSKEYTIEKIYTFAGNLFIGRGTDQRKKIPTSSLILVCTKKKTPKDYNVECIHLPDTDLDMKDVFPALKKQRTTLAKSISQKQLQENVENWNFVKWDDDFLKLYEKYKKDSESMEIYYNHKRAVERFGERFYFDGGALLDENKIGDFEEGAFEFFDYKNANWQKYYLSGSALSYPKNEKLTFPQGSQGQVVFDQIYKIIWRTKFAKRFQYCDRDVLLQGNQSLLISSNSKEENLFLFACLNSPLIFLLLEKLLKNENEKNFLLAIKSVKQYVRIPKITSENQSIKDKVINLAGQMLGMEKQALGDLLELDTLVQRFDDVQVKGSELVLKTGSKEIRTKIRRGASKLVEQVLDTRFKDLELMPGERAISLAELRSLPAFDKAEQDKIKEEIDELVFELYGLTETERKLVSDSLQNG